MRQCKICKGTWVSQSEICIHCGSKDWEEKKQENGE